MLKHNDRIEGRLGAKEADLYGRRAAKDGGWSDHH